MSFSSNLSAIVSAGRFWKNLPLLITFFSGIFCLKSENELPMVVIIVGAISVLLLSFFMTHVNIITDFELDKKRKPHLYNSLWQYPPLTKFVLWIEFLVAVGLAGLMVYWNYWLSAVFILSFGAAAILYSYNFLLPFGDAPKKHRFKVYWWGHFLVVILGYITLWLAGFYITEPDFDLLSSPWLWCFIIISFSEYSVFLLESSIDTNEEQEQEIRSLSAMLGYLKTNWVAVMINLFAITGLLLVANGTPEQMRLLICFLPPMLVRLGYEAYMLRIHEPQQRYKLLRDIPDMLFNTTRAYILITLIFVAS